jgi:hypothetical protein
MSNKENIEIEIIWEDAHLIEVYVHATNGRYCGTTEVYTTELELLTFADKLKDFPKKVSDTAILEMGGQMNGSFCKIEFYCIDGVGHTAIRVYLEKVVDDYLRPEEKNSVRLEIGDTSGGIENFGRQIAKIAKNRTGSASLNRNL